MIPDLTPAEILGSTIFSILAGLLYALLRIVGRRIRRRRNERMRNERRKRLRQDWRVLHARFKIRQRMALCRQGAGFGGRLAHPLDPELPHGVTFGWPNGQRRREPSYMIRHGGVIDFP